MRYVEGEPNKNTKQPPCKHSSSPPEIESCCSLFNDVFHRNNTKQIMMMMKYSLELSSPWLQQYHQPIYMDGKSDPLVEKALERLRINAENVDKHDNMEPMNGYLALLEDFG